MGAPLASGTVLHGRYTVTTLVQAGLDGALYLGSDALAAAKLVVIRENTDLSPEARARFEQEAQLLASLEHPSLPVVLDSFEEPSGRQYLVVLGYTEAHLGEVLAQEGPLAEGEVLAWFGRVVDAIAHLHAQQPPIVHGYVAPAHIVITADGTPHLTGLIELETAEGAGQSEFSHPYLAPEQWAGQVDERSDIYGLGATLYALLTGKAPVDAAARAEGRALAAPRELNSAISPGVEAAILAAMELDPERRPADTDQFWRALTQPLFEQTETEQGYWRRLRQPERRRSPRPRRLLVAGVGVLAVVGVALAVWRLQPPGRAQSPLPAAHAWPEATATASRSTPTTVATAAPTDAPTALPETSAPTDAPTDVPTVAPTSPPPPPPPPTQPPVQWFPGPSATATPRWFPAPDSLTLIYDAEKGGPVEFRWSWPYELAEDEYFDVQVYRVGTEAKGIAWSKERHYAVTRLLTGEGQYLWRVQVIRGKDGQVEGVVSDPSPEYIFWWQESVEP